MTGMRTGDGSAQPGGGICVSIAQPDTGKAISAAKSISDQADVIEIRLDAMAQPEVAAICEQLSQPLLFTNRPEWEGGHSRASDVERVAPLLEAVRQGAAFVDLELKASPSCREKLLAAMTSTASQLIISHHDFEKTPGEQSLTELLAQLRGSGAHIGKLVTMANTHLDVLRVLHLLGEAQAQKFPLIAFCMGEEGKMSRVATTLLGGYMTYAAPDELQATAPGQLSVHRLRTALECLSGS